MREWLLKPLLIVLVLMLIAGAAGVLWLTLEPANARAGLTGPSNPTAYHRQVQQAIRDLEGGR